MASFASRVRQFRSPVVVTVALGAMSGCGGDADGDGKPLTTCPAAAPSEGADCNYDGPECGYELCVMHPTKIAKCQDGAWRISLVSCNPPPPDRVCPDQVPVPQSACDYQGPTCEYRDCLNGATHRATCVENQWRVEQSACNPPPPPSTVCPAEKPGPAAGCNYVGPPCEYDYCGTFATARATCDSGVWTVSQATCNPPPPTGDAGSTDAGAGGG